MLKRILSLFIILAMALAQLTALATEAEAVVDPILLVDMNTDVLYVVLGGESRPLSARIYPDSEADTRIYWMSDNEAVATVDDYGNVTARSLGTATITAQGSINQKDTCTVIVTDKPATYLAISESEITMEARTAYVIESAIGPADADNLDIEWSSSDKNVAVVNSNGKVFSKNPGECWITATPKCGGTAISRCKVTVTPTDKPVKYVALTFDDGPDPLTEELLDLLEMYGANATFFCQGQRVNYYPGLVRRSFEMGNEIANHTYSHETLTAISRSDAEEQLRRADEAIAAVTGEEAKLYRAPGGSINEKVAQLRGKPFIDWNVDTNDWKYRDPEHVWTHVAKNTKNCDIVLMHDIHATTIEAMYKVLPYLLEQGWTLITVSELLDILDWNDPSLIYKP